MYRSDPVVNQDGSKRVEAPVAVSLGQIAPGYTSTVSILDVLHTALKGA